MNPIAITGASGVVGARALEHLLLRPDVEVVALGRRPLQLQHERLESRVVDLLDVPAMVAAMPENVTAAVCCLGTTMKKAGSREAFRAVDLDAVVAFAQAALARGARRFVVVSSVGANVRSRTFYLRTKGEAEEALATLGYEQLTIVRPSFIDDEGARTEHRTGERLLLPVARAVFGIVGKASRHAPITAETIGKAIVKLTFDETTERVRVVESERLQALRDGRVG